MLMVLAALASSATLLYRISLLQEQNWKLLCQRHAQLQSSQNESALSVGV